MAKLILDTGVLIAIDRGTASVTEVISEHDSVALPAIVIAEYLTGVSALTNPAKRASAGRFLADLQRFSPVVAYDAAVAQVHAELLAFVRSEGSPRGAHDLIVAATARATGRTLLTTDRRARFDSLPGVDVRFVG